jgi:hypothetical protein
MNKRLIVIVGILIAAGAFAYYFYKRRKRPFEDYGRADWAGDTSRQNLAFKLSHKPSVKKGDIIDVIFDSPSKYPSMEGEAEVVDVFGPEKSWDKQSYWIVTDKPHKGSGPQEQGVYRKVG